MTTDDRVEDTRTGKRGTVIDVCEHAVLVRWDDENDGVEWRHNHIEVVT